MRIHGIPSRAVDARRALRRLRTEVDLAIQAGEGEILRSELAEVAAETAAILALIERAARESGDPATLAAHAQFVEQVAAVTLILNPNAA